MPLRNVRGIGVWLFIALVFLVNAERRLAEAHYNLRSSAVGIENLDTLDGDEIRARLITANDAVRIEPSSTPGPGPRPVVARTAQPLLVHSIDSPFLRAPPASA